MSLCGISLFAQSGPAPSGVAGVAAMEAQKRQGQVKAAQTLFANGSRFFADGSYGEAMDNYKAAFQAMPSVPAVEDQRRVFFKRYQAAAYQFSQQLVGEARWAEAEQTLSDVMATAHSGDVPVTIIDPSVRTMLGELKSHDERFDQAVTPRHLKEVDSVTNNLIIAKGFLELGDFDRAERTYNEVLTTDPYNTAARRGLEEVERFRMDYYDAAYDHTRSKLLAEVSAGWETPVPLIDLGGRGISEPATEVAMGGSSSIDRKLTEIIIPHFEFNDARLVDVVEFLAQKSQELDAGEPDPSKRGVNFVIDSAGAAGGEDLSLRSLSVRLSNIPLGKALGYVSQLVGMKYRVDRFAVFVVPISVEFNSGLITRRYSVPPGFVSAGNQGAGAVDAMSDPFAQPEATSGIQIKRITAREFLQNSGVVFEGGASASYMAATSTLIVTNTIDQLTTVENMVQSARDNGSKMVKVNVKMVSIEEDNLKMLGLDWLLGAANAGSTPRVFFGGGTDGNTNTPTSPNDYTFVNPGSGVPVGMNPVTSGLRMGDLATGQSIEDVLNRDNPEAGSTKAPGIFSVAGVFTDPQFQMTLRALNQSKGSDLLCDSHVYVKPGQIASIEQVRELIYPTEYDPPEIPNDTGNNSNSTVSINGVLTQAGSSGVFPAVPAQPTAFETRKLGKVIEVEPSVSSDNLTVNLNVTTDFTDFVGFINYGVPILNSRFVLPDGSPSVVTPNEILMPVFDAVKETTNVTVWDGQTIAIGGFHGESVTGSADKIPGLGDLPILGRAFRSNSSDRSKRALIVFVSVLLVDPGGNPINAKTDPELLTRHETSAPPTVVTPPPGMVYPAK